jgi:1,4-alpha-glucan branching enzyme
MPGDMWQQFANLRALYGYMWTHPGKKLLFMGGEFGQRAEWAHDGQLEWNLLDYAEHASLLRWVSDLNRLYREEPALHALDHASEGFEWIDCTDAQSSVIAYLRKPRVPADATLLVVCNFTPVPRTNYAVGVPRGGEWHEVLNSDARLYGGGGWGNLGGIEAAPVGAHGRSHSLSLTLPALSVLVFRRGGDE